MGFDFKSFRRLDAYADNEVDEKSRSAVGGVLSLLWYPAALAWVIWYLVGCVSTGTLLTTQTSFETFSEDPAATELLPPMRCISPGGCWVHPMNASDRSSSGAVEGVECYYLKQNQDFPPFMRRLFLTPDPVQGLSVVFDATPSFFSVSYDQDRIEDLRTGAIKKKERGGLEATTSPRIYQGSALLQLTRTSMGGAIPWSVDSWSSVTTSTFGGVTKPWNKCCKAETVGMVDDNGGDTVLTTDPAFTMANRRCDVAGISQTTIAPFPTINNVQVQDWVMQGFESFGGISGTISLFSIVIIWLIRTRDFPPHFRPFQSQPFFFESIGDFQTDLALPWRKFAENSGAKVQLFAMGLERARPNTLATKLLNCWHIDFLDSRQCGRSKRQKRLIRRMAQSSSRPPAQSLAWGRNRSWSTTTNLRQITLAMFRL